MAKNGNNMILMDIGKVYASSHRGGHRNTRKIIMFNFKSSHEKARIRVLGLLLIFLSTLLLVFISSCSQLSKSSLVDITRLAQLGKPPANEIMWSPVDKNKLLVSSGYANYSGGENYILNIETGEKYMFAQADRGFLGIRTWSPDGDSIVMAVDTYTKGFDQDGLWEVNIIDGTSTFLQPGWDRMIWGPDEGNLTVQNSEKTEDGKVKVKLVLVDRATHEETIIFGTAPDQTILGFSWSPSGEQLAFSMGGVSPNEKFDIYVLDIHSGKVEQITEEGNNKYPVWSPAANLLVYVGKTIDGNREMYSLHLIDPNGICDIELYSSDFLLSPTWSPDGDFLAFIEPNAKGIFTANMKDFLAGDYKKWCK
jgi:WD40 repeat protein